MTSADPPYDATSELYETAPCGLMVTAPDGRILRVNATLCGWIGYTAEQLVGLKRLQDLLTMGCKIFHQTHWAPLLSMQGSLAEVQLELSHRDGRAIAVLVNAIERTRSGQRQHELSVCVATDRRRYERELLLARRRAEELLESERRAQIAVAEAHRREQQASEQRAVLAEQLIGIVSHDLRTPLNAVLLGANLLTTTGVTAGQSRTLGRIVSATNRANRLIADLLDFTQARLGGGLRINLQPLDLHAVVADCVDELRLAFPGRMLEHLQLGDGEVSGDPDRVAQVVSNLVSNALTYGSPQVAVTITSVVAPELIELSVHNAGAPIPTELVPHLFEPLRRGEQQVKLGSRSVGLGLYIVHEIAVAHGGEVSVTSSDAAGTTFVMRIPRAPAH